MDPCSFVKHPACSAFCLDGGYKRLAVSEALKAGCIVEPAKVESAIMLHSLDIVLEHTIDGIIIGRPDTTCVLFA
jgi:hypothetical protein